MGAQTRDGAESAVSRRRSVWGCGRRPRRLLSAQSNRARGPGGAGGRKGRCGPTRRRPRGGRCCPGRGGVGSSRKPCPPGLASLQGRRDEKEWDIPGLSRDLLGMALLPLSYQFPPLARSLSVPYAGHLVDSRVGQVPRHLWSSSASHTGALL